MDSCDRSKNSDDEQPVEVVGVCERAVHEGTIALYENVGGKGTDM